MSFILEALKKSEKKRQDGTAPKLEAVHQAGGHSRGDKPKFLWLLVVVLVLNALVLLWLFGPWPQPETTPAGVVKNSLIQPETSTAAEKKPRVDVALPDVALESLIAPEGKTISEVVVRVAIPVENATRPVVPVQPVAKSERPPLAKPAEKSGFNPDWTAPPKEISSLDALPRTIRGEIPEMHMSVHAFYRDDPSANLVRINGQIMREGASLNNKYLLEKITADGAVFLYSGYLFLVPRKNLRNE